MGRYDRRRKSGKLKYGVLLALLAALLGGAIYLSREMPPPNQPMLKQMDTSRFTQPGS